ncbi:MAG: hypothetical protein B6U65_03220 [Candidatus Wolframiiraptor sp. EX4484-121]|nr:MAG: hypothetical protein B6U65_03220 [Candidatus Wolframiiraptor sp. EX4484-121]
MGLGLESLKREFLELLEKDVEFRYAVAGYLGLSEVLKRLDTIAEEQRALREEQVRLREEQTKIWREIQGLREEQNKIWREIERFREEQTKIWKEIESFREEQTRIWKEIQSLREEQTKIWKEIQGLKEEQKRTWEEIERLRSDMERGFELVNRHISALGARWGLMAEEAFREGLRGLLEEELGLRVERWTAYDEEGYVYGYPSELEVDVAVVDGRTILVEVSSHVRPSDVFEFRRKAEIYERKVGVKPDRLLMVTPYADDAALRAGMRLGVEIYTKI